MTEPFKVERPLTDSFSVKIGRWNKDSDNFQLRIEGDREIWELETSREQLDALLDQAKKALEMPICENISAHDGLIFPDADYSFVPYLSEAKRFLCKDCFGGMVSRSVIANEVLKTVRNINGI